MSYALGSEDLKFVAAGRSPDGNIRAIFECPTWFPRHYMLTEMRVASIAVDQETSNFDMGFFQMRGPVFYVLKSDFDAADLSNELDSRYQLTLEFKL